MRDARGRILASRARLEDRLRRRGPIIAWINGDPPAPEPPARGSESPFTQGLRIHAPAGPGSGVVSCAAREAEFQRALAAEYQRGYAQGRADGQRRN